MAGDDPQVDGTPPANGPHSEMPTPTPGAEGSVAPEHPHPAAAGEGGHVKAGKMGLIIGAHSEFRRDQFIGA